MEGGTDGWGRPVSGRKKKKKGGGKAGRCGRRELGRWADRAEMEEDEVFLFSFFSILFQNQTFQTVFKLFQTHLKLLKLQTFTQNTMQPKYNAQALVVSKFN
jgi:hypothetical protein